MIVTAEIVILDISDKPELVSSLVECVMKCDYGRTKPQGQAARVFFFFFTTLYWFCHTSTSIHHGFTLVPHPEPPSTSLPIPSLWVIPVHQPQASCILHRTWTGDSFLIWYYTCFNVILPNHSPETGAYYTEWSKPERKTPIQYTNAYIWNLERW